MPLHIFNVVERKRKLLIEPTQLIFCFRGRVYKRLFTQKSNHGYLKRGIPKLLFTGCDVRFCPVIAFI